jgi:AraC-like DNA-binding protein
MNEHQLIQQRPSERLRTHVAGAYSGYVEGTAAGDRIRRPPSGKVTVIFGLDAAMLHEKPDRPSVMSAAFVAGLHDGFSITEALGPSQGVQVDLTPIGAYLVLGQSMSDYENRVVDVADAFGPDGAALLDQLGASGDWRRRFALIDAFIASRLASNQRAASPAVVWAWNELQRTHGQARIGDLAVRIGWSRKHLVSTFREQIGLPPKTVAQLLRYERASELLTEGRPAIDVAATCGYADQAHLIRDFRRFSGLTPSEFVQGPERA